MADLALLGANDNEFKQLHAAFRTASPLSSVRLPSHKLLRDVT